MKRLSIMIWTLLLVTGSAWAGEAVDFTKDADPDVTVEIENLAGSVKVTGWDLQQVKVGGTLGDDTEGLEFSGDRQHLEIEVEIPEGFGRRRRDVTSHLEIWLPVGSRLLVETVSASIEVTGISGQAELETVSGEVAVSGEPESLEVETVSGNVRLAGSQTAVVAESVSGSIILEGVAERVEAASVSGDVEVTASEIDRGQFETVSGSIEFAGGLSRKARLHLETHSGNLNLALPADTSATFEIETFSGRIDNEFGGPEPKRTSRYAPGKWLEFATGSGDAQVSIETFSGNVTLRTR
jgi:DUF4097 and DUF4098 domain-containing protein YvlB